jgi:plastocyanin
MKPVKIGLWLPLVALLGVGLLMLVAFGETTEADEGMQVGQYDPFELGFENNCYDCHIGEFNNATYYCHELLPERSYISRVYLDMHYIWIALTMKVPTTVYLPPETTPTQTEVRVNIFGRAFFPATITVPLGGTVTWTNLDSEVHNITGATISDADIIPFYSGVLGPGDSFSHTFDQPGPFVYYRAFPAQIEIPPEAGLYGGAYPAMVGTVIVGGPDDQEVVTGIDDGDDGLPEGHE